MPAVRSMSKRELTVSRSQRGWTRSRSIRAENLEDCSVNAPLLLGAETPVGLITVMWVPSRRERASRRFAPWSLPGVLIDRESGCEHLGRVRTRIVGRRNIPWVVTKNKHSAVQQ